MADARDTARDVAYVALGFAVLAVQRAQVRRRELQKELDRLLGRSSSADRRRGGLGQH